MLNNILERSIDAAGCFFATWIISAISENVSVICTIASISLWRLKLSNLSHSSDCSGVSFVQRSFIVLYNNVETRYPFYKISKSCTKVVIAELFDSLNHFCVSTR